MRLSYKGGFYTHEFTSRELSLWFYHDLYKERLKLRNLTQSNKISSYLQLSRIRLHFWTSLGNFCKYIRQDAATNNLSQKKEHFLRMKFIPYNSNCLSLHIGGSCSRFEKGYFPFSTSLNKLVKAEIQNILLGWEERVLLLNCSLVPRPSTVKRLYISFYGYTVGSRYEVNWTLMRFTKR